MIPDIDVVRPTHTSGRTTSSQLTVRRSQRVDARLQSRGACTSQVSAPAGALDMVALEEGALSTDHVFVQDLPCKSSVVVREGMTLSWSGNDMLSLICRGDGQFGHRTNPSR